MISHMQRQLQAEQILRSETARALEDEALVQFVVESLHTYLTVEGFDDLFRSTVGPPWTTMPQSQQCLRLKDVMAATKTFDTNHQQRPGLVVNLSASSAVSEGGEPGHDTASVVPPSASTSSRNVRMSSEPQASPFNTDESSFLPEPGFSRESSAMQVIH